MSDEHIKKLIAARRADRARIRQLEAANYRLTEERDRLKGWADKYHDEVLELQDRLATAEADALEMREALQGIADYLPSFDYVAHDSYGHV